MGPSGKTISKPKANSNNSFFIGAGLGLGWYGFGILCVMAYAVLISTQKLITANVIMISWLIASLAIPAYTYRAQRSHVALGFVISLIVAVILSIAIAFCAFHRLRTA